jgi:hypothetical protein
MSERRPCLVRNSAQRFNKVYNQEKDEVETIENHDIWFLQGHFLHWGLKIEEYEDGDKITRFHSVTTAIVEDEYGDIGFYPPDWITFTDK